MAGVKNPILWRRIGGGLAAAAVVWPLCACQSVSESQTTSLVRVVDASYNAPAVDVYAGKTEIAKNVAAGTITSYAILAPGPVTVTVDAAGTEKPLASLTADFEAAGQESVYLKDTGGAFAVKLLRDQAEPAPVGEFSVRFLQAAGAAGAVDVYFLPSGETVAEATPVVKGLEPGQSSGYVNVPDGSYRLAVTRAGGAMPVFTGSSVSYAGGEVRTVLIQSEPAGQPAAHAATVRVVMGDDSD